MIKSYRIRVPLAALTAVAFFTTAMAARPQRPHTTNEPLPVGVVLSDPLPGPSDANVLWYKRPPADWLEALPVGNGSFGGMVFGGIANEKIQYNHDTIWTHPSFGELGDVEKRLPDARPHINRMRELIFAGKPAEADKIYKENISTPGYGIGAYQPMATLRMKFEHDLANKVYAYQHRLDMGTGVAATEYKIGNTHYLREVFAVPGQNLMICRITATGGGKINARLSLERQGIAQTFSDGNDKIALKGAASHVSGKSEGTRFITKTMARTPDGSVSSENGVLTIKNATEAVILIAGATDFDRKMPFLRRAADLGNECDALLESGGLAKIARLQTAAASRHAETYGRLKIDINNTIISGHGRQNASNKEMDTLERVKKAGVRFDTFLAIQLYQYARYLLICSSHGNSLPATLQGRWNDLLAPPWNCDYHFNINIQMNYLFAPQSNLLDTMPPYLDFLDTVRTNGRKVAREMYGARGFVAGHATAGYATVLPTGRAPFMIWKTGGAWAVNIIMEYVRFSGDTDYLRREGLRMLEEASLFILDWMAQHPKTGELVVGPGVSPEHFYYAPDGSRAAVDMGCAMDQQLAHQLFVDYLEAAAMLQYTSPVMEEVRAALPRLAPTRLTKDGRICEWSQDFRDFQGGHRHLSHLYAFYPGSQFTPDNDPAMVEAARKTVQWRKTHPGGAGKLGWSRMWIGSLHARFRQGDEALEMLEGMIASQLFPNLLAKYNDTVFQIDGNFGYAAVVNEMLLQSHAGYVELLPALPSAWKSGKVTGMLARGGYEFSFQWTGGVLVQCAAKSKTAGTLKLKYKNRLVTVEMGTEDEKSLEKLFNSKAQ